MTPDLQKSRIGVCFECDSFQMHTERVAGNTCQILTINKELP